MKKVFLFLTTGFEEIEALTVVDVLRRAGVDVSTVSLTASLQVVGSHGIAVMADVMFDAADFAVADMLVIPGGTVKFNDHEGLKQQIAQFAADGRRVAAICAAPMVLGGLGLLEGRRATCYPGFEDYLKGATLTTLPVVTDGKITTGRSPGAAILFALELVSLLEGDEKAAEVRHKLVMP